MASKSIYVASRYSRRDEMRKIADQLRANGYSVTSSWLGEDSELNCRLDEFSDSWLQSTAKVDLRDIAEADIFLFFSEDHNNQPPRGGRHVEFGYALSHGLEMWVVGDKENIFHYLPEVTSVADVKEFLHARG